jgi:hypothetical protein
MRIIQYRKVVIGKEATALKIEATVAFIATPTIVLPARANCRLEINLLYVVLSDIADEHITGQSIEAEALGLRSP